MNAKIGGATIKPKITNIKTQDVFCYETLIKFWFARLIYHLFVVM